jgi:hypothetical protein
MTILTQVKSQLKTLDEFKTSPSIMVSRAVKSRKARSRGLRKQFPKLGSAQGGIISCLARLSLIGIIIGLV